MMSNPARMVLAVGACSLILAATASSYGANGTTSVWQGVYTKAQAERGRANYFTACASCHGTQLQGDTDAPDLAGNAFVRRWSDLAAPAATAPPATPT